MKNKRSHENEEEYEEKPFVKEIVMPPYLYKRALQRGYQTYKEVGFYLVGIFKKGVCFIFDLVEFDYSEQSGGFIESEMARYLRLKAGLPLGIQIVGHIHKHPGFTSYSAMDKGNFLQYGRASPLNAFLIYIVDPHEEVKGYTATAREIFPVKVTIRDFTPEENLIEKEIKIEFITKVVLPKNTNVSDFRLLFSENISSESLKFLSRPTVQVDGLLVDETYEIQENSKIEIIPRKAIAIENVANNTGLQYRVFMEEQETIADLEKALKQLINLPQEKGYEIIFYESGRKLQRDTKLKDIKAPLVWSLEKSLLFPVFQNFYKFWLDIIEILYKRESEKLPKKLESSDLERATQISNNSLEKSGIRAAFKNFSMFLDDFLNVLQEQEEKKSKKVVKIQEEYNPVENNEKKEKKHIKRYSLDYYT